VPELKKCLVLLYILLYVIMSAFKIAAVAGPSSSSLSTRSHGPETGEEKTITVTPRFSVFLKYVCT